MLKDVIMFAANEGGHFAQLMALQELFSKYNTIILTDNKRANLKVKGLENVKAIECAMAFSNRRELLSKQKGKKLTRFSYLTSYIGLFKECYTICKKYKPKVIISTGSNIAVALCLISKVMGIKFVFIETRAKVYSKTVSGKIISPFADRILVQWPEMLSVYNGKAQYYGILI